MIALTPLDLALAGTLVALDAGISLALRLDLHRRLIWSAVRMVVQLVAVGYILRFVFALQNPAATLAIILVMALIATREMVVRPNRRLTGPWGFAISGVSVAVATLATAALALFTAIRPHPWYDPRYAIALSGIILGNVLSAGSLALDSVLGGVAGERAAIEARLGLGETFRAATGPLRRDCVRRGLLPMINQMSAAGVVTLPGTMTGQILAGVDPMEAIKYQILLMFLLAGASGLAVLAIAELTLARLTDNRDRLRLDRLKT